MSLGEINGTDGGSPVLFQHLFWFFGHPEVYIVALPAFGIVSDLLSTHARKNIFGYRMMVWAIVAIGALSFIVWAHHMYVSGMNPYFGFFFATTTLIIAIPTAIKVYNWVLTLWRGDIQINIPNLFAIGFIFTFVHGGLTGLFLGNVTVDLPLSDTYFVIGHFHMVMGVSPVMVLFGAIYHWFPKISGKMPNELLGRIHFWMTFLGTYAIYLPMHYIGILGMPRRYYAYGTTDFIPESAHAVNEAITIAAIVVAMAQLIFLVNVFYSLRKGKQAPNNPWGATTLEWQTPQTPPVHGNWGPKLPVVYRWAYDYSVPGEPKDFIPQNEPPKGHHVARRIASERAPRMLTALLIAMLTAITVWWLLIQRLKDKPWTEAGRRADEPGDGHVVGAEGRPLGVPRRRLELVRFVRERLLDAHGRARRPRDVAAARRAERAVDQHAVLVLASGAMQIARNRIDARRSQGRPLVLPRRGRVDARVPRRPDVRVAAGCARSATSGPASPAFALLRAADGHARPALDRRLVRARPHDARASSAASTRTTSSHAAAFA